MEYGWYYERPTEEQVGDDEECVYHNGTRSETISGRLLRKDWYGIDCVAWHPLAQFDHPHHRFVVREIENTRGSYGIWDRANCEMFNRYRVDKLQAIKIARVLNNTDTQPQ